MGRGTFTLRARADRIELRPDGTACIVDYKTGTPPSGKMIFTGFSPQLTLEAAMLMHGAFADLPAVKTTPDLLYVHASGGRKPFVPIPVKPPRGEERGVEAIVAEHAARLRGLVARFMTGEAAYTARPYPQYASKYGAYDHLARVLDALPAAAKAAACSRTGRRVGPDAWITASSRADPAPSSASSVAADTAIRPV